MVGKVGQDSFGQELLSSASASGVDVSRVIRDPEAPSAVGNVQLEVTRREPPTALLWCPVPI